MIYLFVTEKSLHFPGKDNRLHISFVATVFSQIVFITHYLLQSDVTNTVHFPGRDNRLHISFVPTVFSQIVFITHYLQYYSQMLVSQFTFQGRITGYTYRLSQQCSPKLYSSHIITVRFHCHSSLSKER